MRITLTVNITDDDHPELGRFLARCKKLEIETCAGDRDGRRWMQISGIVDEQGLFEIVESIAQPEVAAGR